MTTRANKYKHEVRVTEAGDLQPVCFENNIAHWQGEPQAQSQGLALAHVLANDEINQHVKDTGHVSFKNRHGSAR